MQMGDPKMAEKFLRKEGVMNPRYAALNGARVLSGPRTSIEERALVAQAKAGSSGAFGELYERHRHKLYRSTLRILRNRQDAEDAVQRSFQRAFTNLSRFREDSAFSTWMTRIAINEALMLLRQRRMPSAVSQTQQDSVNETRELDLVDERPTPEEALAQNELRALLIQAISGLRWNLQSVVLLRDLQGLTNAETARRLGLTISSVKARAFHAKRCLRQHFERKNKAGRDDVLVGAQR